MQKLLVCFLLILFFSVSASSCGCGMALAPPEIFNSLKESQAYLMVDITGANSYTESPYFRFVSFDKEYDVKMVFPMKSLPTNVEGKKLTLSKFLMEQGVNEFKSEEEKQDLSKTIDKIRRPLVYPAGFAGLGVLGTIGASFVIISTASITADITGAMNNKGGLVASYTFDGGTLEIYDVSSKQTLSELVDKLGFTAEGEVKKLVDKYADYYVAVMTIHVPTVLPKEDLDFLDTNCKTQFEKAKLLLQTKPKIEWEELGLDPYDALVYTREYAYYSKDSPSCDEKIIELVNNATNPSSDVNGVFVSMSYNNADIFYPTSIVNSYAYPVSEQSYFVRTPKDLQFSPKSNVSKTVLVGEKRWYVVTDTSIDLEGTIAPISGTTLLNDSFLGFVRLLNVNSVYATVFVLMLFLAAIVLFYFSLPSTERLGVIQIGVYVAFGMIIGSIVAGLQGKKKIAIALFIAWIILLLISII